MVKNTKIFQNNNYLLTKSQMPFRKLKKSTIKKAFCLRQLLGQ